MEEVNLEVYDPTGAEEVTQSFAPRLADLNGKTICELSNGSFQSHRTFPVLREVLQKRFPKAKIIPYTEFGVGRAEMETEQSIARLAEKGCDAVITGNAAWGSCSTSAGRAAAKAELQGIPSMVITREDFNGVVINAFAGLGFGKDAPFVKEFPDEMFRDGSDLSPIERNLDKIIYGLTKWEPKVKAKGKTTIQKVTVTGKDYVEAIDNMNNLFLRNLWSDGLPLIPPTEERVNWILTGTDLSPDTVVAKILPRGGIASVKALAICLAMAGGRPEYLPILIAAVEAFTVPEFRHDWMNTTTGAVFPAVIVNGPIAKQIRLNSGYGCLGPRPAYPAGGRIGRAIRLVLMCLGGGIAGINTMSIHGNNRYTNVVIAEDEAGLPPGWEPFSVEHWGYPKGTNVVTVVPVNDVDRVMSPAVTTKENMGRCVNEYVQRILCVNQLTRFMGDEDGFVGMALMPRDMAGGFARFGLSRADVQKLLWEKSITPWETIENVINPEQRKMIMKLGDGVFVEGKPWPITARSENIMVVVNGGAQSDHAAYLRQGGASGYVAISKEIKLPIKPKLEKLLKEAELAMGPASQDP